MIYKIFGNHFFILLITKDDENNIIKFREIVNKNEFISTEKKRIIEKTMMI